MRITEALSRAADHARANNLALPEIETDRRTAQLLGDLISQDLGSPMVAMVKLGMGDGVVAMFDGVKIKARS